MCASGKGFAASARRSGFDVTIVTMRMPRGGRDQRRVEYAAAQAVTDPVRLVCRLAQLASPVRVPQLKAMG